MQLKYCVAVVTLTRHADVLKANIVHSANMGKSCLWDKR